MQISRESGPVFNANQQSHLFMDYETVVEITISLFVVACLMAYAAWSFWEKRCTVLVMNQQLEKDKEANEKKIENLESSLEVERQKSDQLSGQIVQISTNFKRSKGQGDWCEPRLLDMPIGTPEEFHRRSLEHAQMALSTSTGSFYDLRSKKNLHLPGQWELYWCVAHASRVAATIAPVKMEDGITGDFVHALEKQVKTLSSFSDTTHPPLRLAFSKIYEQSKAALKEAEVGADLLLIVAGDNLIPGGGARLFWIQAKKAPDGGGPYILDCSYKNKGGLQLDALKKVQSIQQGSFSAYVQYSDKSSIIPAYSLKTHTPPFDLKVDLSKDGLRLAEFITAYCALNTSIVGAFADARAVISYIKANTTGKPLYVVAATEDAERYRSKWNAKDLVSQIERHYKKELGIDHQYSRDLDRDNGPRFSR